MKDHYVLITEVCKCGSKISIEHTSLTEVEQFLVRWRAAHTHLTPTTYPPLPQVTWGTGRQPIGGGVYTVSADGGSWTAYNTPEEPDEPLGVPA